MAAEISGEMVTEKAEKIDADDETKSIQKVFALLVRQSRRNTALASHFSYRVAPCFESSSQD